jgi:hypothetical protein
MRLDHMSVCVTYARALLGLSIVFRPFRDLLVGLTCQQSLVRLKPRPASARLQSDRTGTDGETVVRAGWPISCRLHLRHREMLA